jgi:uncharacterized protein (DUF2252 family)
MAPKTTSRSGIDEHATPPGNQNATTGTAGDTRAKRLTVEERRAAGHALRERVSRSSHAFWAEAPDRPDPIALLEEQAKTRLPDLVPIRYARMRVSPFAFFRGSANVMAEDLARTPTTGILTQLCGDAHLANFGAYASPERTLLFDMNDFDETYPGPWEWDVKRLAASFYVAGRANGFAEADCRTAVLAAIRSYRLRMTEFASMRYLDLWYSHVTADEVISLATRGGIKKRAEQAAGAARRRDSLQALAKLTEVVDGNRLIANDPPLVTRVTDETFRRELAALFEQYTQTLRGSQRHVLHEFQIIDAALKVVGVGSVGTRCYIVLLAGRDENDPLFLQVKEAEQSVLQAHLPTTVYQHQGERVVAGQQLMQAASDIFLGWVTGQAGRHFYVRQLRDMKGSAAVETFAPSDLALYAELCGWVLARAHARAGGSIEISAYLGASDRFDQALATFAEAYANQTERDYQRLLAAIKSGRIVAAMAL